MLDEGALHRDAGDAEQRAVAPAFGALVALTFGLIVVGALVRAHGAGLACPDWPLCFGALVPSMDFRVAFEYTHRVVAGCVALGFAGLAVFTWRRTRSGDPIRPLLALAAVLLAAQVLLGALTVWQLLAAWSVTSHLLTGNAFAATLAWIVLELHDRGRGAPPSAATPASRRWLAAVIALLWIQMTLGGLVSSRYAGLACPEWPTCNAGLWFPAWRGTVGLHLLHRMNGYLLVTALGVFAWTCRGRDRLPRCARLAATLGGVQVVVGVANVLTGLPVEVTGLHSALAAALVLTTSAAAREAWARPSELRSASPRCAESD